MNIVNEERPIPIGDDGKYVYVRKPIKKKKVLADGTVKVYNCSYWCKVSVKGRAASGRKSEDRALTDAEKAEIIAKRDLGVTIARLSIDYGVNRLTIKKVLAGK